MAAARVALRTCRRSFEARRFATTLLWILVKQYGNANPIWELSAVEPGTRRVAEVLFGCVVGIVVAWLMSRLWPLPEAGPSQAPGGSGPA